MSPIELNKRQEDILQIVKENGPITGEHIAERLNLTNKIPVHIIMTRMPNISYCERSDSLIVAANKLIEREVDSLPVVEPQEGGLTIVGRLTKTTITRAFLSLAQNV